MSFLYPSIALLGVGFVLIPVVVHLISRRRRQRIEWAAMDFLLESNKKNSNRSRLEEWLLLLLRILAVALVAIMAAVPQLPERLSDWFEGAPATHLVVLDDSYSMSELTDSENPWRIAKEAIERLSLRSKELGSSVKLVRYSDYLTGERGNQKELVGGATLDFEPNSLSITKLSVGPAEALKQVQTLLDDDSLQERRCYVTLLSDFQRKRHASNQALADGLESLSEQVEGIVLAPCSTSLQESNNLTLASLSIEPGPRAIGVEATAKIRVTSYNATAVAKQNVEIFHGPSLINSLEVGPFAPNESLEVTFPFLVQKPGPQLIRAKLPTDSLAEDNERYLLVNFPKAREVLVVDGSSKGKEGVAFAAALAPQISIPTGWRPRLLRTTTPESFGDLSNTAVVCLLDVSRLGQQALRELATFVQQGGGLLNVLGPQVDRSFYNRQVIGTNDVLFPLMPARLDLPTQAPLADSGEAMIRVNEHPTLRILAGQRNGFLPLVRVGMFHTVEPANDSSFATEFSKQKLSARTLIELVDEQSNKPLLMEHKFGRGRIMTLFTTATPQQELLPWSNLATLPIFPVIVNEMSGWLAQNKTAPLVATVGDKPPRDAELKSWKLASQSNASKWQTLRDETEKKEKPLLEPGGYRLTPSATSNVSSQSLSYFAVNTNPVEGDLSKLSISELSRQFDGTAQVIPAQSLFLEANHEQSWKPMQLAGIALLLILIVERFLATRCSHVAAAPARPGGSGL